MAYSSLAGNIFDLHLVEVFRNLSFVVVQRVEYFHTNKLNFTLTPQAQLSLQGTFFSFLIMLNSELCAWGVKTQICRMITSGTLLTKPFMTEIKTTTFD